MRRVLYYLVYVFFLLLFILPLGEFSLRGWEHLVWATNCIKCQSGLTIMGARLNNRLWTMFLGTGAKDLRVLPGNMSTADTLPPGSKWDAVDFLVTEELRPKHHFTVTSDSLGFRGAEQKVPAGVRPYRVLVLGSYQAFGHGVSDEETYSAVLLKLLKKSERFKAAGLFPVVWNGGMQSASLERGVAVLERRLAELKPDLVILDYGMTDQVSKGLNPWLQPFAALADQDTQLYRRLDDFSRENSTGLLGKSYLFTELVNHGMEKVLPPNRDRWEMLANAVIAKLKAENVKVLLLDQPVAGMPPELYRRAVGQFSNADFLSVKETLSSAASAGADDPDWMEEFPASFRRYFRNRVPYYAFLGSILHINANGHRAVARAIEGWIERNVP